MMRFVFACGLAVLIVAACSGSDGPTGGPVTGAADTHCTLPDGGVQAQPISLASCVLTGGDAGVIDYGETQFNAEGDDDDCKYHVRFTSTPVRMNSDVNFTVVATQKAGGAVAGGAKIDAEVFLNLTHPAPNSGQHVTESPAGTYLVGPVRFDATGRWTVRFHLHEECSDLAPDSPHGHIAFFIDVP
jgi:hypothetical protein